MIVWIPGHAMQGAVVPEGVLQPAVGGEDDAGAVQGRGGQQVGMHRVPSHPAGRTQLWCARLRPSQIVHPAGGHQELGSQQVPA